MVSIEVSEQCERIFEELEKGTRLIILQGGTSSGKTFSTLQALFRFAATNEGLLVSVVSYALPHLKLGAMRDFDKILLSMGIAPDSIKNKTDSLYKINRSIIEFFGTENLGKVHGPRREILYVNEANNLKYDVYTQLAIRTKKTIIVDYNPVSRFWAHDELIPNVEHTFIKSTYLDNPFLDPVIVKDIESKKNNENWWRVYGMGEVGQLEGTILSNWRFGEFDHSLPYVYGLDFGYHPDPDACVKIAIDKKNKKMYWDEIVYQTGNGTEDLRKLLREYVVPNDLIVADSAEKRLIKDLKSEFNIKPVIKKPGSVKENLLLMQDYEHIVTESSYNLAKELNNYCWNDKKAGVPIDQWNHLIDAGRYVFMNSNRKKMVIV